VRATPIHQEADDRLTIGMPMEVTRPEWAGRPTRQNSPTRQNRQNRRARIPTHHLMTHDG